MNKPVGFTKDIGWQMGVRRTFPIDVTDAWTFLFSTVGIGIWLGKVKDMEWTKGHEYKTSNGTHGVVRVITLLSHVRITWKKKDWDDFSTLQMRTIRGKGKTTVSFHQDRLKNQAQREEMLAHWEKVLSKIERNLK